MLRFLIALLLLPVLCVCAWQAWPALQPVLHDPQPLGRFGVGAGVYLAAWALWLRRRPESMWSAFEHELTHALFCVAFGRKVHEFHAGTKADAKGRSGFVSYDAPG
ncbi:MAG: hypothetical protein FJX76_15380, partial [Armatimonadetes bacterium]|nr:hypothetical protein [Armatimonadota bacterium]